MVSLTLAVSEELRHRMAARKEIKWSEVVRSIIARQLDELDEADRIAGRSRLGQRDADELGAKIDEAAARKWKALKA